MGSSRPTIQCNGRAGQWRVLQEGLLGPPSPTRPGVGGSSAFFSIAAISAACGVFMTLTALSVVSSLQTSPFRTEIGLDPLLTFLRDDRSSLADLPKGVFGQAMLIGPSAHGKLCQSLTLAQEVGTRRSWIPPPVCEDYLRAYVRSGQYRLDFAVAVHFIEEALLGGPIKGDGTDMVVLDIDETALSNLEYYKKNRYGTTPYNVTLWNEWVLQAEAQPYEPMLRMYERLQSSNWTFAFVTGRDESQRTATEHNLHAAGFRNWTDLILRTEEQLHLPAATYKSQARAKLETAGYTLWGNIGDQWSDLEGYSTGVRTFKLPNPFYFVP